MMLYRSVHKRIASIQKIPVICNDQFCSIFILTKECEDFMKNKNFETMIQSRIFILPQAIKVAIPPLANSFISMESRFGRHV
jgi:hypothetical protein